jgi:hypothetical protein
MAVVFFEGFNFGYDAATLDTNYWSANRGWGWSGDGRTGNAITLPNRDENTPTSGNATLTLSNFTDPLSVAGGSNACLGLGFWVGGGGGMISGHTSYQADPYLDNLVSLTTSNGTLSIDLGRPSDSVGVLLVVRENGTILSTYDLRSAPGHTFGVVQSGNAIGSSYNNLFGIVNSPTYFDFFFDAANGVFSVRAANTDNMLPALLYNNSGAANTAITSFNSVTAVTLYGKQNISYFNNGVPRRFDDFYLTTGAALSDVFLGSKTRIYRSVVNNTISSSWASDNQNSNAAYALTSNNGDGNYIKSFGNSVEAVVDLGDLPGDSSDNPSYVSGVQFVNVVRTAGPGTQYFKNIAASTSGDATQEIGPTYTVTGETYVAKKTFFFTNPLTGTSWSKTAVNNMVIGVKNKS